MPEMNAVQAPHAAPTQAANAAVTAPPAVAAVAPATDASKDGADFAAVLQKQLRQPAKTAGKAEAISELADADRAKQDDATEAAYAAPPPDLNTLLPGFAQLMQPLIQPNTQSVTQALLQPLMQINSQLSSQLNSPPTSALLTATASATDGAESAIKVAPIDLAATSNLPVTVSSLLANAAESPVKTDPQKTAATPAFFAATDKIAAEPAALTAAPKAAPATESFGDLLANVANQHASAPQAHANAMSETPATAHVSTPVGTRGWDNEVAQKVVWLSNRQDSRAELTLTPPNMGKIEITLTTHGDQTDALFVSASPAARDALEQALPRLRELLADAGITLGQSSVSAESSRQNADERGGNGRDERRDGTVQATTAPAQWIRRGDGLVDTFA